LLGVVDRITAFRRKIGPALRKALGGVLALFPNREFFAAPTFPEEYGRELFEPMNFQKEPLNQFYMTRPL